MDCITKRQRRWIAAIAAMYLCAPAFACAEALPAATVEWKFVFNNTASRWTPIIGHDWNSSSSTPAIAPDGTIYVGSFTGTFYAISHKGEEKWRFKAGREIASSPAIADDGTIYFGSRDRNFYALTSEGKLKWKFATSGWVDSSPAIGLDGTTYFGSWDGTFYALSPNGSLKWKFATSGIVDSSPAIATNGTIYFGSHDKYFYALNPNGALRWKYQTGGEIVSSPAIGADGLVYFTSMDGNLYALNPDGKLHWQYRSGSWTRSSPVLDAEGNIAIGHTNRIDVISKDGQKLWHQGGAPLPVEATAASVANHIFYMSMPWHLLLAVEPVDHPLWQLDTHDMISSSLTVGADGTIYACARGVLLAIHPPDKALPLSQSPWPMFRANAQHTGRVENQITH